jgi:hypothetical protein
VCTEQVGFLVARHGTERLVDDGEGTVRVQGVDGVTGRLDGRLVPFEFPLALPAVGDTDHEPGDTNDLARRIEDGLAPRLDPLLATVVGRETELDVDRLAVGDTGHGSLYALPVVRMGPGEERRRVLAEGLDWAARDVLERGVDEERVGPMVIGQTRVQTRRLNNVAQGVNEVEDKLSSMSSRGTRTDGGQDLPARDEDGKFTEEGTSGGGALGGMIAGAALGSSYGPAGTVAGALFGAIIGDELEEQSLKND